MPSWEYRIIAVINNMPKAPSGPAFESLESKLDEAGRAGWELVGVASDDMANYRLFFKRPLER